jgi:predicted MFS family arabinose efflux permease
MTELSWASAFILGMPVVAFLIASWGWVAPFPFLSGLAFVGILLLAWTLPRDIPSKAARSGWLRGFRQVLGYGPAISGLVFGLLMTSSNETVNLVFGIWMEDSFHLKLAALGLASMVVGFAELSAEGLASGLADRLGKNRAVQLGLLLNCLAAALFPVFGQQLVGALVVLFLFYLTFEFEIVCSLPLMTEVLPAARGSMLAISYAAFSLGRALGALISPYLYQNWGIVSNAAVAILLNLIALLVLRGVRLAPVPDLDRT